MSSTVIMRVFAFAYKVLMLVALQSKALAFELERYAYPPARYALA